MRVLHRLGLVVESVELWIDWRNLRIYLDFTYSWLLDMNKPIALALFLLPSMGNFLAAARSSKIMLSLGN
jgi:hypothetical protein